MTIPISHPILAVLPFGQFGTENIWDPHFGGLHGAASASLGRIGRTVRQAWKLRIRSWISALHSALGGSGMIDNGSFRGAYLIAQFRH